MTNLLDPLLGQRARALFTLTLAVATALLALAQGVLETADVLPQWKWVAIVGLVARAVISGLTTFTRFGTKLVQPEFTPDSPEAG